MLKFFYILVALGSLVGASAQVTLIPRPAPVPDYVLGVGDQLLLHVTDLEDIPDKPIRIDANGYIDLPLVGKVLASGLTVDELRDALATKLSKFISSPQISINLTEDKGHQVSVIGAVNTPGVQQLIGSRRLIDVLAAAGGTKADAGSTVTVTRQYRWGKLPFANAISDPGQGITTVALPLEPLLNSSAPAENLLMEPNDIVAIPKADVVYVVGNVKKAGGFALPTRGRVSVLQAISLAEGLDTNAKPSKARIIRPAPSGDGKATEIPVDISKIFGGSAADVPLFANDILFIPNSAIKANAQRATDAILSITTGLIIYRR